MAAERFSAFIVTGRDDTAATRINLARNVAETDTKNVGTATAREKFKRRNLKMITVKVIRQDTGKPAEGRKVSLGFNALFSGGVTNSEYTDSNGEAHFDSGNGDGQVYVDGVIKHKGYLSGRIVIYI